MNHKSTDYACNVNYHIVFPLKYKQILQNDGIKNTLKEITQEISQRFEIDFECVTCDVNQMNILCSFHPKYSLLRVIEIIKTITERELLKRHNNIKDELWGGELWGHGYNAFTIGKAMKITSSKKNDKEKGQEDTSQLSFIESL